jgi:DNA-binding transcriptional ArsR family regulator
MSLIGNLNEIKLAEVLRLFATGKKTGRLTVSSDDDQTVMRFEKGALVHAHASGSGLNGEPAVLDLFGWPEGQLTFIPEERPVRPNVTRSVEDLVTEGLREGDAVHRMNQLIPNDKVVFQIGLGPRDGVTFTVGIPEWRVLRFVDGIREVREVVEASAMTRPEVTRLLFAMSEAGLVDRVEPGRQLRAQTQGLFGKDAAGLDDRLDGEWRLLHRFGRGVHRVEVRSGSGRSVVLPAAFRSNVGNGVHLPRGAAAELQVKDGEDVEVRPIG